MHTFPFRQSPISQKNHINKPFMMMDDEVCLSISSPGMLAK